MPPAPSLLQRIVGFFDRVRLKRQHRSSTGYRGEEAAADHLQQKGYRLLARNLCNRFGEIDLIALTPGGKTTVIVEVKTAEAPDARPELRVDPNKQRRLVALAAQVVRRYKLREKPVRFDVVAVNLLPDSEPIIRHYEAAFESHV